MSKVTDEQAAEIRRLREGGARTVDLQHQFGVSRFTIRSIVKGLTHNPKKDRAIGNLGLRNPNAKLDADAVFVMRWMHGNFKMGAPTLAKMFGVSDANVTRILNRNWWKQVPETIENVPSNLRPSVRVELQEAFQEMFGEAGPALLDILTNNGFKLEKEVTQEEELKVAVG